MFGRVMDVIHSTFKTTYFVFNPGCHFGLGEISPSVSKRAPPRDEGFTRQVRPWFGIHSSATARVISRFGLVWFVRASHLSNNQGHIKVWFGLLGIHISATAMVTSRFGLVYWGLTPQQQPGSYQGLVWFIGV